MAHDSFFCYHSFQRDKASITVYEPPKEYWNDNDVVTLIQENKNEEEKKKEESQNNVIKEVQENGLKQSICHRAGS